MTRLGALGLAVAVAGLAATVAATPHSGMLSGPTARTWWEATRRSFNFTGPKPTVTPSEADVDKDPDEAEAGAPKPAAPGPDPVQRQALQGVVAEYVIYIKYLSLRNFREGPVDWRMERFQYASLVPLRDLNKPDGEFRVEPARLAQALDDIADILVEIGEPGVPLMVEALANDHAFAEGISRRVAPLDYRTIAGVPDGDYNVQALEQFDDIGYKLGNYPGWVPGTGFTRNADYRDRAIAILLRIGRPALPAVEKAAQHKDPKVAEAMKALAVRIRNGELPVPKGGAPPVAPLVDPAEVAKRAAEAKAEAHLAKLYALWQEAEVRRDEGKVDEALALYRKILASEPPANYIEAAKERIAELSIPAPGSGGAPESK